MDLSEITLLSAKILIVQMFSTVQCKLYMNSIFSKIMASERGDEMLKVGKITGSIPTTSTHSQCKLKLDSEKYSLDLRVDIFGCLPSCQAIKLFLFLTGI